MKKRRRKNKNAFPTGLTEGPEFECRFQPQPEWSFGAPAPDEEVRCGRYHGSMFWEVPGFGKTQWVVVCNIIVDWESLVAEGHSEEEIFRGCIKFLNKPPARKKFQRRQTKPLYGDLSHVPVRMQFKEKRGDKVLQALIVTNKRRCKQFWSEGIIT